jgi:hypothetical protein
LRHLPGGIHGVIAAVVEKIADVVRLEDLDQALVLRPMLLQTFQLVSAGTKGTTRRMTQAGYHFIGFETGVNQVFGQGADNTVAPGEYIPDLSGCRRASWIRPHAVALMTAVTPPTARRRHF